jgi:hypothetical protein
MPELTRWYLRAALVYFVVALGLGLLQALRGVVQVPAAVAALYPTYVHLLTVGWLTQLIFGVVWWMFPRHSAEMPYRSERLGRATFALLNGGLLLRVAAEPLLALSTSGRAAALALAASALLQWLAGLAFVTNTWPRVKER